MKRKRTVAAVAAFMLGTALWGHVTAAPAYEPASGWQGCIERATNPEAFEAKQAERVTPDWGGCADWTKMQRAETIAWLTKKEMERLDMTLEKYKIYRGID